MQATTPGTPELISKFPDTFIRRGSVNRRQPPCVPEYSFPFSPRHNLSTENNGSCDNDNYASIRSTTKSMPKRKQLNRSMGPPASAHPTTNITNTTSVEEFTASECNNCSLRTICSLRNINLMTIFIKFRLYTGRKICRNAATMQQKF